MREKSVLEVLVDDVVLMEVVDSIENRADHSDGVVFSKLSLCEDAAKELSTGNKFERKVLFCAWLEALVKFDLGWVRMSWVAQRDRQTDNTGVVKAGDEVDLSDAGFLSL